MIIYILLVYADGCNWQFLKQFVKLFSSPNKKHLSLLKQKASIQLFIILRDKIKPFVISIYFTGKSVHVTFNNPLFFSF